MENRNDSINQPGPEKTHLLCSVSRDGYAQFKTLPHFIYWLLLRSSIFRRTFSLAKFILHLKGLIWDSNYRSVRWLEKPLCIRCHLSESHPEELTGGKRRNELKFSSSSTLQKRDSGVCFTSKSLALIPPLPLPPRKEWCCRPQQHHEARLDDFINTGLVVKLAGRLVPEMCAVYSSKFSCRIQPERIVYCRNYDTLFPVLLRANYSGIMQIHFTNAFKL